MKKIIVFILQLESRLILRKYRPTIIAVTGNAGKTSAKEAIATVLERRFSVRKSIKSYNSELGVPLAIIGRESGWRSPLHWAGILLSGLGSALRKQPYPNILVLEVGADRPGDIAHIAHWLKPDVVVMTAIGEVPVHVEFFAGQEALAKEKAVLLRYLRPSGTAILNTDDEAVSNMKKETNANIVSYGFNADAHIRASEYALVVDEETKHPVGVTFKIDYNGNTIPVRINGSFGKPAVYAALAACAVGIRNGMHLIEIAEMLQQYHGVPGRLRLIEGIKGSIIIDDTYNASPTAMHAALDLLRELPARRRIVFLGDMLEIGKYTIEAHSQSGLHLAEFADMVITVGQRAKFIAEGARTRGMPEERIRSFLDRHEVLHHLDELQALVGDGDVILVKGSQAMRMEHIVEMLMAHPEKKQELLVRQEEEWKNK